MLNEEHSGRFDYEDMALEEIEDDLSNYGSA
jgi:hypothetical protein